MPNNATAVNNIAGKMECTWLSDANAILDTCPTYDVSLEDFRRVVLVGAVAQIKSKGAVGYIVDSSSAEGAFSEEIQNYAAKTGPNGLKLVEVDSVADAIGWLNANS